jgi:hypothetical protein
MRKLMVTIGSTFAVSACLLLLAVGVSQPAAIDADTATPIGTTPTPTATAVGQTPPATATPCPTPAGPTPSPDPQQTATPQPACPTPVGQTPPPTATPCPTPAGPTPTPTETPTPTNTATPTPQTSCPVTTGPVAVGQGGGTVSTGTTPTASDPVQTSVVVPAGTSGGDVTISEGPVTTSQSGYTLLGQQVVITTNITGTTPANPLAITFNIDASVIPSGQDETTVAILKNGTPVPNCNTIPPPTLNPDPCVSSRVALSGGDIQISVLTSTASTWNFGVAVAAPSPTPTVTPHGQIWGDFDCMNGLTIGDAQKIARHLISLAITQGPDCPQPGQQVMVDGMTVEWGDLDCQNGVTIGDAQKTARKLIDLSVGQAAGCPAPGDTVQVQS